VADVLRPAPDHFYRLERTMFAMTADLKTKGLALE